MSEITEKSGNKGLIITLVILCLMIVGLGVGIGVIVNSENGSDRLVADCLEKIDEKKKQYDDFQIDYEKLGEFITLYDECLEKASLDMQVRIRRDRASFISLKDDGRKYGDLVLGDAVFVDDQLQEIETSSEVANYAVTYVDDRLFEKYNDITITRIEESGGNYYGGGSG